MTSVTSPVSVSLPVTFEITSVSGESVWVTLLNPVPSPSPSIVPLPFSLIPGDASESCLFTLQADVHAHILASSSIYWLAQSLHSAGGPQTTSLLVNLHSNSYALIPLDLCLTADFDYTNTNVAHLPILVETDLTLILSTESSRNASAPQDFNMDPPTLDLHLSDIYELLDPLSFLQHRYYDAMYSLGTPLLYFVKLALARFRVMCESNNIAYGSVLDRLYLPMNKLDERHLGASGVIGFPSIENDRVNDVPDEFTNMDLGGHSETSGPRAPPQFGGDESTGQLTTDELHAASSNPNKYNLAQAADMSSLAAVGDGVSETAHTSVIAKDTYKEHSKDDATLHLSEELPFLSFFKNTHRHVLNFMAQCTTEPDFADSADLKVFAAHSAKLHTLVLELKIREAQLQLLISIELVGSWGVDEQDFLDSGAKMQAKEAQRRLRRMATSLVRRKKSKKHSVVQTFLGMGVSVSDRSDGNSPWKPPGICQHDVFTSINAIIDRLALWDTLLISTASRTESQLFAFFAHVIVPYYSKRFPILTKYIVNEYKLLSVKVVSEKDVEKEARRAKRLLRRESAPLEQTPTLHRALTEIDAAEDPLPTLKRSKSNLASRSMIRREVDMALSQKSLHDAKVVLATPVETSQAPTNIFRTSRKRKDMDILEQPQVEATPAKLRPRALATPHDLEQTPRAGRSLSMPNRVNQRLDDAPSVVQTPRREPLVPVTPFARRRLSFGNSISNADTSSVVREGGIAAHSRNAPINSPFWTVMSTPLSARHPDTPIRDKGHPVQRMKSPEARSLRGNTSNDTSHPSKWSSRQSGHLNLEESHDLAVFSSPVRGSNTPSHQKISPGIDRTSLKEPNGSQEVESKSFKPAGSHEDEATKAKSGPFAKQIANHDNFHRAKTKPLKRKPRSKAASATKRESVPPQSESRSETTEMVAATTVEDQVTFGARVSVDPVSASEQTNNNTCHIALACADGSESDLGSDSDFGMLTLTSISTAAPRTYSKRGTRKGFPKP